MALGQRLDCADIEAKPQIFNKSRAAEIVALPADEAGLKSPAYPHIIQFMHAYSVIKKPPRGRTEGTAELKSNSRAAPSAKFGKDCNLQARSEHQLPYPTLTVFGDDCHEAFEGEHMRGQDVLSAKHTLTPKVSSTLSMVLDAQMPGASMARDQAGG